MLLLFDSHDGNVFRGGFLVDGSIVGSCVMMSFSSCWCISFSWQNRSVYVRESEFGIVRTENFLCLFFTLMYTIWEGANVGGVYVSACS